MQTQLGDVWILGMPFFRGLAKSGWKMLEHGQNLWAAHHMMNICQLVTLWLFNIAMENGPFIDGLPIRNGDFAWLC